MSDNRIIECMERAQYLLGNLMAVKPGEEVLIVVDPQTDERMTQAMAAAALNCGAEYGVYMMPIRGKDKATIFPKSLELGMDACDVFVGMTTASGAAIYNNHLKELINQKKLREVSICLRSIDNFTEAAHWQIMKQFTQTARSCRQSGEVIRWLTSPHRLVPTCTWK